MVSCIELLSYAYSYGSTCTSTLATIPPQCIFSYFYRYNHISMSSITAKSLRLTKTLLFWEDNSHNHLQFPKSLFWTKLPTFFLHNASSFLSDSSLKLVYKSVAKCGKITKTWKNYLLSWIKRWPSLGIKPSKSGVVHS